jgi:hypothetical protein
VSPTDTSSKQKISKEILELNGTLNKMDLTDIYGIFHSTKTQYALFSAAHGKFSKADHNLGHEGSLSKYKKIKIIHCILSDYNVLILEFKNKNNSKNYTNNWRLSSTFLNHQQVIEEIRGNQKFPGS